MDPDQNQPDPDSQNSANETTNPVSAWQENNENQTPAYNNTDYWNTNTEQNQPSQDTNEKNNEPEPLESSKNNWDSPVTGNQENSEGEKNSWQNSGSQENTWTNTEDRSNQLDQKPEDFQPTNPWTNTINTTQTDSTPLDQSIKNEDPAPKPPSKSSNTLMVVMVALVVVLLGTTGLFAFQNYQLRQTNKSTSSPTPVASENPSATPDPTADWKTYTNTILRASFKYPSTWTYKENANKKSVDFNTTLMSEQQIGGKSLEYIFNFQQEDPKNFQDWSTDSTTTKLEPLTQNGMVFEKYITSDSNYSLNFIYKSSDGKIFRFYLWPYTKAESKTDLDETIALILTTFKLDNSSTASPSPTSSVNCSDGFEKFTNSNFSFCYPTGMKETTASTATSVVLENSAETLKVVQNFQGGWGGSPCLAINAVEIAGYKSKRLSWKTEKADNTCDSTYTSFATMVNEGVFKAPFPYMMEYTKKSGTFTDDKNFLVIEGSFTPAK